MKHNWAPGTSDALFINDSSRQIYEKDYRDKYTHLWDNLVTELYVPAKRNSPTNCLNDINHKLKFSGFPVDQLSEDSGQSCEDAELNFEDGGGSPDPSETENNKVIEELRIREIELSRRHFPINLYNTRPIYGSGLFPKERSKSSSKNLQSATSQEDPQRRSFLANFYLISRLINYLNSSNKMENESENQFEDASEETACHNNDQHDLELKVVELLAQRHSPLNAYFTRLYQKHLSYVEKFPKRNEDDEKWRGSFSLIFRKIIRLVRPYKSYSFVETNPHLVHRHAPVHEFSQRNYSNPYFFEEIPESYEKCDPFKVPECFCKSKKLLNSITSQQIVQLCGEGAILLHYFHQQNVLQKFLDFIKDTDSYSNCINSHLLNRHAPVNRVFTRRLYSCPSFATDFQSASNGCSLGERMRSFSYSAAESQGSEFQETPILLQKDQSDILERLSEDGLADPCVSVYHFLQEVQPLGKNILTVALIYCQADEDSADIFIKYLSTAFPFIKIITNLDNFYKYDIHTRWQKMFDTEPCVFIVLTSQNFLNHQDSQKGLELASQEMTSSPATNNSMFTFFYLEAVDETVHQFHKLKKRFKPNLQEELATELASFHGHFKENLISTIHENVKPYLNCREVH